MGSRSAQRRARNRGIALAKKGSLNSGPEAGLNSAPKKGTIIQAQAQAIRCDWEDP